MGSMSEHMSEELSLVPLHQRPELMEACAQLLGEEWGKSQASRLHSLQRSSDTFPTCLLLLQRSGPAQLPASEKSLCQLLGHVRLSRVAGHPHSLFVESVVVPKALRGQGYGRKLMEATERYARARGFHRLHLTTHDKQHFYAHLGYTLAEPVQIMPFISTGISAEVLQVFSAQPRPAVSTQGTLVPATNKHSLPTPAVPPVVPPPPPLPLRSCSRAALVTSCGQSLLETPHRDAKGLPIFWMQKDV